MSQTTAITAKGSYVSVEQYSIECPFCHSKIIPNYICSDSLYMFCSCPNSGCGAHFVLLRNSEGKYVNVLPNAIPCKKSFSDIIISISPAFV